MSELRKTYRHATIYGLGVLASRMVSFIMLPIYTRHLTPADYGVLELLVMTVDIVALVVGVGISNGLFKFYYEKDSQQEKRQLVSTAFQMVLAAYTLATLICILNANFFSGLFFDGKYRLAVQLAFWTMLFQVCITIPLAYLRALQKPITFVAVSLARLVLSLSLNIYFIVIQDKGVMGAVYADFIVTGVIGLSLAVFTFLKVGFSINYSDVKKLYKFGVPFILTNIGAFILTFSDRYFLRSFGDLKEVGIYALGYKLGFLLSFFVSRSFNNVWEAQRFELVKLDNFEEKFNIVFKNYTFFLLAAFMGFSLFSRDFFRIMSAPGFISAYQVVPIVTMAYVVQALTTFFNFGIFYSGKSMLLTKATFYAVIAILALSFMLIPILGGVGAAISTLGAFVVRFVFVYRSSQKSFRISYNWLKPIRQFVLAIAVCVIYFFLHPYLAQWSNSVWLSLLFSGVFFSTFLACVFVFQLVSFSPKQIFSMAKSKSLV